MRGHFFLKCLFGVFADRHDRVAALIEEDIPQLVLDAVGTILQESASRLPCSPHLPADNRVQGKSADNEAVIVLKNKVAVFEAEEDNVAAAARAEQRVVD